MLKVAAAAAKCKKKTHPRQINVGHNDLVKGARRILAGLALVTTGVVLVFGVVARVPGLGALGLADGRLGRRGRRVAAEVPAYETKGAGHDCEEDLLGGKKGLAFCLSVTGCWVRV